MSERDRILTDVARYYSGKVEEHGPIPAGVDWNGESSQRTRFHELARLFEEMPSFSVNDYGCGYGALLGYLEDEGCQVDYRGFDISEAMIERARGLYPEARFTTVAGELEPADFTVASGIFNVLVGTPAEDWRAYCVEVVRQMRGLSRRGLAFNMLTSYSDPPKMRPDLYYADPLWWFDWCKRNLSRHVALLHDYGLWEFTVLVRLER